MKLDIDTIRKIILTVEDANDIVRNVESVTDDDFKYHTMQLKEAGFIKANVAMSNGCGPNIIPGAAYIKDLTWEGHELAFSMREELVWNKAKKRIEKIGSWTFSILVECLKDEIKKRLTTGS